MEKNKIKEILREGTQITTERGRTIDPNQITTLSVMDFDGTTMDTLTPERAKPIYKEKTGEDWPFKGWWGRPESLNMDIFDFEAKPEVKSDYQTEAANNNTMLISLTGRRKKLGNQVEAILNANGYKFDKYLYNYGSDTLSNKIEQMTNLLKEFPNIRVINMWDDRLSHFEDFNKWGNDLVKSGRLDSFNLTEVPNPQWTK